MTLSDTLTQCHTSDNSHNEDECDAVKQETQKKPRIRGYRIGSDDDKSSSEDSHDDYEKKPLLNYPESDGHSSDDGWEDQRNVVIHFTSGPFGWLVKSILPSYTEKVPVQQPIRFLERILASFTTYKDLKDATLDSHYEAVFARLQQEWTYVGGLVCSHN
jgi:hypothetical protein